MNLLIDYDRNQAFSHAWSLCVEEHFYLIFPLLAWWLATRATASRFLVVCAAIVILGIALRAATWLHYAAIEPQRNWFIEELYYPTWMRLDGLLMGVMLAAMRVYRPQIWERLQLRSNAFFLGGLALCCFALWLFRQRTGLLANSVGWPVLSFGFALLVFAGADRNSLIGRWRVPGVGWLAAISYSLYLSHKIAFHVVSVAIAPLIKDFNAFVFLVYALVTILFGAVLHYLVERPFLHWRDRRGSASTATTTAAI